MWFSSVFGCTHVSARVYLIRCVHSHQNVIMCVLLVHFTALLACCAKDVTGLWKWVEEDVTWNLALWSCVGVDAEHPDARFSCVTIEVCTFNETISRWSVLDQAVLSRQLSDDWASERYGNGFVSADESRLYAIVRSLKLAVGVWWSPEVYFLDAEILGRVVPETGGLTSV